MQFPDSKEELTIIPGNAQAVGARSEQQDDFGFSPLDDPQFVARGGVLAVLTDGMGGLAHGREAGRVAKQTMLAGYAATVGELSVPEALTAALTEANQAVVELGRETGLEGEVGTTLVAAVVKERQLYWVSVGDSRIYLYRGGEMYQLTTDHDYGRELAQRAAAGEITWEEAMTDPQRQALTSYLGLPEVPEVHRSNAPLPLAPGDRILLCSDGLYRALSLEEMATLLAAEPQEAAEALVAAALAKGDPRQDNLTVAILACESGEARLGGQAWWRRPWGLALAAGLTGLMLGAGGLYLAQNQWPHLVAFSPAVSAPPAPASASTSPPALETAQSKPEAPQAPEPGTPEVPMTPPTMPLAGPPPSAPQALGPPAAAPTSPAVAPLSPAAALRKSGKEPVSPERLRPGSRSPKTSASQEPRKKTRQKPKIAPSAEP